MVPANAKPSVSPAECHGSRHGSHALILALIYGAVLASLPIDIFKDRQNYLTYAASGWDLLQSYWAISPLAAVANEPLWLMINAGLGAVLEPEMTVRLIIFMSATAVAMLILLEDQRHILWLLLFLLMAQVIKNHVIHLRQGVAIAFFLVGYVSRRPWVRRGAWLAAPLIHASFFFVLALWWAVKALTTMRLSADIRALVVACAGICTGIGIGWMAEAVGARQAMEYEFEGTQVSGLGFAFWFSVFLVMCLQGRRFARDYAFELSILVFYLSTYFLMEVTARIFESGMLPVLLASRGLTGYRKALFEASLVLYFLLQWALRINESSFGFGEV